MATPKSSAKSRAPQVAAKKKASAAKTPSRAKPAPPVNSKPNGAAKKPAKPTSKASAEPTPKAQPARNPSGVVSKGKQAASAKPSKASPSQAGRRLNVGDRAPDFELQSVEGKTVRLRDLAGKRVVLYFYPRDNTPGCTQEACDFRDLGAAFREHDALVFGVSPDSLASHGKFRDKFQLDFPLLSDPDNTVATAYGAYGEKSMYGRKMMGIIRSTFVIDPQGAIEKVYSPVRVNGHAQAVLDALQ